MAHYTKPDGRLLRDRLCKSCAGGQHAGEACASCRRNTVRLRSGDVLIFHGRDAFHGLSAVVPEEPPSPPPPPHAPQLPPWARSELSHGGRISVQWRLSNARMFQEKESRDQAEWNTPAFSTGGGGTGGGGMGGGGMGGGGTGGGGMGGGGVGGAQQLDGNEVAAAAIEEQLMQQAMAASMASLQQGHSRRPQAGAPVPMTASCEEEQLQQAIAASLAPPPASSSLLDNGRFARAPSPVAPPPVARPLRGSGMSKDAPVELSSDEEDDEKRSTARAAAAPIGAPVAAAASAVAAAPSAAAASAVAAAPSAAPVESAGYAIGKRSRSDGSADEAASSVASPKARMESEQDRVRKARLARFA